MEVRYTARIQPEIIHHPTKTFVVLDLCAEYLLSTEIRPKTGAARCVLPQTLNLVRIRKQL